MADKLSVTDFAAKIKAKYPDYANIDDGELTRRIVEKYPDYADVVEMNPHSSVKITSGDTTIADSKEPYSVSGFAGNVVGSAGRLASDIGSAIMHPIDTASAIGGTVVGAAEKLIPGTQPQEKYVDALVKTYVDRYGGMDNLKRTAYEDPVGMLADFATLAGGTGLVAKGVGMGAKAAKLGRVAQVAEDIARGASMAGEVTDPLRMAVKGTGAAISYPVGKIKAGVGGRLVNPNITERAAAEWGLNRGIPVDAGTASGNKAVKGVQFLADRSLGAGLIGGADAEKAAADAALAKTADQLAAKAYRLPVEPEQAGSAVSRSLGKTDAKVLGQSDEAYAAFRAEEAKPENIKSVQIGTKQKAQGPRYPGVEPEVAPIIDETIDARLAEMKDLFQEGIGDLSGKAKNIDVMDWNPESLSNLTRKDTGFGHIPLKKSFPELSGVNASPGEIADALEKKSGSLYKQVRKAVQDNTLETMKDDIEVANERAVTRRELSGAPAESANEPIMKDIPLPVDMRPIKAQLAPIYQRAIRWIEPAKRNASAGIQAMKSILEGEDFVQASEAEHGLSGLKQLVREGSGVSAGIGKLSTKALQEQIDAAVKGAESGSEAYDALVRGRAKYLEHVGIKDTLDQLRKEPVETFRQMIYSKDAGIGRLRQLAKLAPKEMPKVGRAYLEDLLKTATNEGGMKHTDWMHSQWSKLGDRTKEILYKDPALVKDLDQFFLLAKKMGENINPSGSGYVVAIGGQGAALWANPLSQIPMQIGAARLSKMLHSPAFVRALMNGMNTPRSSGPRALFAARKIMAELERSATAASRVPEYQSKVGASSDK